jgi:hypothetical protein
MNAQSHDLFDAGGAGQRAQPRILARAVMPEGAQDAAIRFVAQDTGAPLAWHPYRLQIGHCLVLGRTDGDGCSARLNGAERAQLTGWELA